MNRTRILVIAAALSLVAGLTARPGVAGELASPRGNGGDGRVVRWEVELPGAGKVVLAARSGETARVTRQDGSALAFVPVVGGDGGVTFKVFDLLRSREGRETLRPVDEIRAEPGAAAGGKAVTGLSLTLLSEDRQTQGQAAAPVRGLPLSDTLVHWKVEQPNGRAVQLTVREGEIARIGLEGQWYGLVPVVKDRAAGEVSFRVFSLQRTPGARETLRPIEGFELQVGSDYLPDTLGGIRIVLAGLETAPKEDLKAAFAAQTAQTSALGDGEVLDSCCVRCGGTEACGCSVAMDCGDCCVPPCCYMVY